MCKSFNLLLSASPCQTALVSAQLTGFSPHVSFFTDRGAGVRRSGRLPITKFANVTFPDAGNGGYSHAQHWVIWKAKCAGALG